MVDPVKNELTERADCGFDLGLEQTWRLPLGIINVMVSEGLYDKAFVNAWTLGFEQLSIHVRDYTPAKVESITWVPKEEIVSAARVYSRETGMHPMGKWDRNNHK